MYTVEKKSDNFTVEDLVSGCRKIAEQYPTVEI